MEEEKGIAKYEPTMTPAILKSQVNVIKQVMSEVMVNGRHYGVIPGCGSKPTLLKPGAEKLSLTFGLRPIIDPSKDVIYTPLGGDHREVRIYVHITNRAGEELATGVGSASTLEAKYRYRNTSDYEVTDQDIPKDAKEKKTEYRKQGFGMKKVDGVWKWVKYKDSVKSENPDLADTYNTVLKMAKKRAYIDGILSATGASDIFTQDVEDKAEGYDETEAEEIIDTPLDNSTAGDEPAITEKQGKMLYAKWKERGIPDEEVKTYLKNTFGVEHIKEIKSVWFDDILAWVKNWKPKQ